MKDALKFTIYATLTALLFLPLLILTILIWSFGGWTKGWDYMPNPIYWWLNLAD